MRLITLFTPKSINNKGVYQKRMCLAVPGKIIDVDEKNDKATVDYGDGTTRLANISLVQVKRGEYVLVHAGFAIQKVDPMEAKETLQLFNEMMMKGEES